ncbi:MAG: META domain-containing protein [Gemmatimonadales bacterium]|nr:MAG: META domain-containing protein [Gemmatimonadales bacterium]
MRISTRNRRPGLAALLVCLSACGPVDGPASDPPAGPSTTTGTSAAAGVPLYIPTTPTAWRGELPCADCAGIRSTLLLSPDGAFTLEEVYLGVSPERAATGDTVAATRGRWTLESGDLHIRLDGGSDGPRYYRGTGERALRALDRSGGEIDSELNYTLERLDALPVMEGTLREHGLFTYMADAALFVPCASGIQTPVAMEGGYLELEQGYMAWASGGSRAPGAPMQAWLTGSVELRPAMEGDGTEDVFVVREWEEGASTPSADCPALATVEALAGGEWRLVSLVGEPVGDAASLDAPFERPTLAWDRGESQVSGTGGCNRFVGRGILRGTELVEQAGLTATRRYCEGAMEVEVRYLGILSEGGHLRLDPGALRLFHGPREVARFEGG